MVQEAAPPASAARALALTGSSSVVLTALGALALALGALLLAAARRPQEG